jgi:hypothetical protein
MPQKWYFLDQNSQEHGPISLELLLKVVRMAPQTLVRKESKEKWKPACDCEEIWAPEDFKRKPRFSGSSGEDGDDNHGKPNNHEDQLSHEREAAHLSDVLVACNFQPPKKSESRIALVVVILFFWLVLSRFFSLLQGNSS